MTEKRRMTTRYGGEPPPKRREVSPPITKKSPQTAKSPQVTKSPQSAKSPQTTRNQARKERTKPTEKLTEKTLPSRVADNAPLPTLKERQLAQLSLDEYKSVKARFVGDENRLMRKIANI